MKVDLVVNRLPQKAREVVDLVTSLMGLTFCVILTWKTWELAWSAYRWKAEYPLEIPLFPIYLIMPIGAALISIEFFLKITHHVSALRRSGKGTEHSEGVP